MTGQKVTICDIARELGVSPSTVGRALDGTGRIGEKTRKRVMEAASRMGYKPSLVAKSLASNKTCSLGVVMPMLGDTAFSTMLNGIENVAYDAGYNITICCSQHDANRQQHYLELLQSRRVDGIIIVPARTDDESYIEQLVKIEESGLPIVVLSQNIKDDRLSKVVSDNYSDAKKAVDYLIKLGHKKIGFLHLGIQKSEYAANERLAGYRDALREAGLKYSPDLVSEAVIDSIPPDHGDQPLLFSPYYETSGHPTAILAVCDMLGIKIIQACNEMGLRVPHDIAVVGIDDIIVSAYTTPSLTTVHQPTEEIGRRAADILLGRIDGTIKYQVHEKIQGGRLIIRQSCGAMLASKLTSK